MVQYWKWLSAAGFLTSLLVWPACATQVQLTAANFHADQEGRIWAYEVITKRHPWANIKAYGAKVDGITDDAAAIQAAIDAMAPVYGIVLVPEGRAVIRSPLTLKTGVKLYGYGSHVSGITADGCDGIVSAPSAIYCEIRNIEIAQTIRHTLSPNMKTGIKLTGSSSAHSQGNILEDVYADGFQTGYLTQYVWDSTFRHVKSNFGQIGFKNVGLSVNNEITGSSFNGDGSAGSKGIYFYNSTGATEGWFISNTLIFQFAVGIEAINTNHVYMVNNGLDMIGVYGILLHSTGGAHFGVNWNIANNQISMMGTAGKAAIAVAGSGVNHQQAGARIIGNYLKAYASPSRCLYGIHMPSAATESKYSVIQGNSIQGFSGHDIFAEVDDLIISGNYCLSLLPYNLYVTGRGILNDNMGTVYSPPLKHFLQLGSVRVYHASSMPASGSFKTGDIVLNAAPAILGVYPRQRVVMGWTRLTTGSSHLPWVDWAEISPPIPGHNP